MGEARARKWNQMKRKSTLRLPPDRDSHDLKQGVGSPYKAQVRSSMEYACPRRGRRGQQALALLDKVQGRAMRPHQGQRCRAGTDFTAFAPPRLAGLTVMHKVHQQRGLTCTHPAAPTAGSGYYKGRCSSPRRVYSPDVVLGPTSVSSFCVYVGGGMSPCLAATPNDGTTVKEFKELVKRVAAEVNARRSN
ncbi:hypothetical protein GWK47_003001 [Chionoecetes opilio]|uniref:Uncharacterized protein n=1 Tax=Chionoecetes opilio TaxID=41210 RepID=A0A8J8WD81_CHIOP|nr:hypothetical protein GWK47_003001 [Chionoecetes opilio]